MGEILDYFKDETRNLFHNKKNVINLLILGILILGIPLGVNLVRTQQIIKSRAAVDPITFTGPNVRQKGNGAWVATKPQIELQLTSPLGPPAPGGSPIPSASPAPSGSPQPRACTVSWTLNPASPPANSNTAINITGLNDPQGWLNVQLWRDGQRICTTVAECNFSVVGGSQPVFTYASVNAGAAGTHTLTFKTNNGSRTCGPDHTYTAQ